MVALARSAIKGIASIVAEGGFDGRALCRHHASLILCSLVFKNRQQQSPPCALGILGKSSLSYRRPMFSCRKQKSSLVSLGNSKSPSSRFFAADSILAATSRSRFAISV